MTCKFTLSNQQLPNNGKILIVEDDITTLSIIEMILNREGIPFVSAINAEDAIHIFNSSPNTIQAVVSDVVLPSTSGIGLARLIHDNNSNIPFLFSTSIEDPNTSNLLWQHGMVYKKPIQEDFPAAIRRLIMCANNQTGMFGINIDEGDERRTKLRRKEDNK